MRFPRALLAVAVTTAALGVLSVAPAHGQAAHTIVAGEDELFTPSTVSIALGDTVTWEREGPLVGGKSHTVTATSANWDFDEDLTPTADTASYEFTEYGTYTFVCEVHPDTMKGSVRVPAPPKPTPRPTTTRPTASPRPTSTSAQPRPTSTSTSPTAQPTAPPTGGTASTPPLGGVVTSPTPGVSASAEPAPSLAPLPDESPPDTVTIGGPGLTPPPATGRERGVWVMLACVAILGVGSAQLRTLLVVPLDTDV